MYHSYDPANKSEVSEMLRIDPGGGVDLEAVVGVPSVLKQAVHGVEHLVGEGEEPFPGRTTIVQTLFPSEHNVEPSTEVLRLEPHDLAVVVGGGGGGGILY